jgi:phage anti-repressor protein
MATGIVSNDLSALIDGWMEAEQRGILFPVPFDRAWAIAGHSTKGNAKRKLESFLEEGFDYLSILINNGRGKPLEDIRLTCSAFKELCMISKTDEGKATRLYFIEAEKKWRLVQQHAPSVASEVEVMHLKIELARVEAQKSSTDLQLIQFRHIVTTTMPEPIQQKILGYAEIKTVEYLDRIIHNDDVINDGSTVLKTELCKRYGVLTRNGKPDYKRLNAMMEKLPRDALDLTVRLRDNYELKREYLPHLDEIVRNADRNLYLGE